MSSSEEETPGETPKKTVRPLTVPKKISLAPTKKVQTKTLTKSSDGPKNPDGPKNTVTKVPPKPSPKKEDDFVPPKPKKIILDQVMRDRLRKILKDINKGSTELRNVSEIESYLKGLPASGTKEYNSLDFEVQGIINAAYHKAESMTTILVTDSDLTGKSRFELCKFSKRIFPAHFNELIQNLVDVFGYKKDQEPEMITLYDLLFASDMIPGNQKMKLALKLYAKGYLMSSFEGFKIVAQDPNVDWKDRLEACKFLLVGDEPELHSLSQEVLCSLVSDDKTLVIIEDPKGDLGEGSRSSASEDGGEEDFFSSDSSEELPDFLRESLSHSEAEEESSGDIFIKKKVKVDPKKREKLLASREAKKRALEDEKWKQATMERYNIIADFLKSVKKIIRKTKKVYYIPAILARNFSNKLIPAEGINLKEFITPVSIIFYNDPKNHIRQRIMACSIVYECGDQTSQKEAFKFLMSVGSNNNYSEDERADAIDKITLYAGKRKDEKSAAYKLLMEIGTSSKDTSVISRIKTIYNNSQNVHDDSVTGAVLEFIDTFDPFKEIYTFVEVESQLTYPEGQDAKKCRAAIYRCSIDHAKFGEEGWTVKKIFCYVWSLIQEYRDVKKVDVEGKSMKGEKVADLLEKRFVDALVEMGDTCTTGHVARLVGVMEGFGLTITISYKTQIKANVSGRIMALVRDEPNEETKEILELGVMEDCPEDIKQKYRKWMKSKLDLIVKELWKEFSAVKIKKTDFDEAIGEATKELMS